MKLVALQENLAKGLAIVSRSVAVRPQLPALANILLATDKGRLKLSATNLETGINFWIGAKIEKEGALSVPAKVLTEFVSSLPADKVSLEVKGSQLQISSGSYVANLVGLAASEFPPVPTLKGKEMLQFPAHQLVEAINQVAFAAAQDEGRPTLTGVLLVVKGSELTLVATDGYRLSLRKMTKIKGLEEIKEFKKGLLIPGRTLQEVGRIIGSEQQEEGVGVTITPGANQVIFSTREAEVVSRLIEGNFPEFEKIIPGKGTTRLTIETEILTRCVRVAAIFARESANIVRLEIDKDKLKISSNSPQVGDNLTEVEVKTEGKANKIAFNARYLLEFLNAAGVEQIAFEMTDPLNPGVFTPVKDSSYLHLIMPVRVQE